MDTLYYSVQVTGRVQGVGFRYHTQQKANSLQLIGWVQNLSNGNVLINVCGPSEKVLHFCEWCKVGISAARVDGIEIKEINTFNATDFIIKRKT